MKKLVGLLLFVLILPNILAITITEIEINPEDGKLGIEWVEIYNEKNESVDISSWSIWDGFKNEKKRYEFDDETEIEPGEYIVVEFDYPVLNNANEYVVLKNDVESAVDKTDTLNEKDPSIKTWQLCDNDWEYIDSTKGEVNNCPEDEDIKEDKADEEEDSEEEEDENKETEDEKEDKNSEEDKSSETVNKEKNSPITLQTINLDAKDINSEETNDLTTKYSLYAIIGFLILILVLMILKNKRYNKNEFN